MAVWEAISAQDLSLCGESCGIAKKECAGIQSNLKGSCNDSAQGRGSCLKYGRARAMNVINDGISSTGIVYYIVPNIYYNIATIL